MERHDLSQSDAWPDDAQGDAGGRVPIDVLIRSGLRRAFPLPAQGRTANDDRFRRLLNALGRCQAAAVF